MTGPVGAAVWALALGQTLTYAGVYYAFPALLPDLLTQTGWTSAQLAIGPTLAFLITAGLTPVTGRLVDRGWGGEMLIGLPIVAAFCVAAMGFAPNLAVWTGLWAVIGVTQAGMFYETCFAFLTRRLAGEARAAITRVTLVAGLAGTLAFPLAHALAGWIGPGATFGVFGALIFGGAVPLNLFAVRRLRRSDPARKASPPPADPAALGKALRRPSFWALAGISGALGLNHAILLTFVLVLFAERGADPALAALAAACIGPAQVLGRLTLMSAERRVNNIRATLLCIVLMVVAGAALILAGAAPGLIFAFAALQGAGMGTLSILRPVLIAQTLGHQGFGAISGAIAVAPILATALGPMAGAFVIGQGGAGAVYALTLTLALVGLALALWLARLAPKEDA